MPPITLQTIDLTGDERRLVLAAADIRQVVAAAERLGELEPTDVNFVRALETAIAVCYWRPFSRNNAIGPLPTQWEPETADGLKVHRRLEHLRDKVGAHTDPAGGRKAQANLLLNAEGELVDVGIAEEWDPLAHDELPAITATCRHQAERFLDAAVDAAGARHRRE